MNCKQFNNIPLEEVLASLGHLPTKQNEKEAWYLNPFAGESQASFKLDKRINLWFLHSEGIGGNNTDFIQKYFSYSVKEVLDWASAQNFSSFQQQTQLPAQSLFEKAKRLKPDYRIDEIKELQNDHLKKYLQERGLSENIYPYVKEVIFTVKGKQLYAIGFRNQSGGYELRNSFYKGSVLKKDISVIRFEAENKLSGVKSSHTDNIKPDVNPTTGNNVTDRKAAVFEGFIDALSFMELQKDFIGDLLILNSTSLVKKVIDQLKSYRKINLFLDNDHAGLKSKSEILKSFPSAIDCSKIYSGHKDLNDYLIYKTGIKANTAEIVAKFNSETFKRESLSQAEPSEVVQQRSGHFPTLPDEAPNHQKIQKENTRDENRDSLKQEDIQYYRRKR